MSKKKINNRLNKLFQDIENEPDAKKNKAVPESEKKANRRDVTAFPSQSIKQTLDASSAIDISNSAEQTNSRESTDLTPSTMLSTAFRIDEKNWATLKVVDELEHRTWGVEEQMLVKQVADQLSLALENARLFQEAQRRAREMTALADVARDITATLELQQVMDRIANQALLILDVMTSAVYVPDPEFKTMIAISVIGEDAGEIKADPIKIGMGILGNIAFTKVAEIINDTAEQPNVVTITGTKDSPHKHLMAVPIVNQDQLSGLLVVWREGEDGQFSETELEFLVSLAQQASIAVENARLFEVTQERAEELSVLNEMARELSTEMNITSIAETVYHYVNRLVDITNFYVALLDENTDLIDFPVFIEHNLKSIVPSRKPENGLTEYVIRTREPLLLANNVIKNIELMGLEAGLAKDKGIPLCWLGVPLLAGNKAIGAMTLQSFDRQNLYSEHDKDLMMTVASQVAISMENARLFKKAQARAHREKILREITARIRATNDPEMIAKAAVRELGQALNVPTFIRLGKSKILSSQEVGTEEVENRNEKNSEGGI